MSEAHIHRAAVLLRQERYDQAARELRGALADDPDDAFAHALLAIALSASEKYPEATEQARAAIHLGPDLPLAHYALANVLGARGYLKEAEAAIREAIRLDPEDPDHFGVLARLAIQQRRWQDALGAADQGLRLDPEHDECANLRAMALVQLGRKEDAGAAIEGALARDPENALTHANQGWALLHQGRHKEAMESFREALRLDPELEWARAGIVEALKARHLLYGLMLRYFLWMSRLSARGQWAVVLGGVFGVRILRNLAREMPALRPVVTPIVALYLLFALLTWTADPLFNVILRLNRFGRLALSREQIVASNWVGGSLLGGMAAVVLSLALRVPALLIVGAELALLILPLAGTFRCKLGWPRLAMGTYTAGVAAMGLAGALLVHLGAASGRVPPAAASLLGLCLLGILFSTWIGNLLALASPKR
ncbi:MAG: tetratricopeptide repeat protein [Armatimonadetes bacterium]|nr:tetratricopeptide repeat protein [Armatimonadota bacterium]